MNHTSSFVRIFIGSNVCVKLQWEAKMKKLIQLVLTLSAAVLLITSIPLPAGQGAADQANASQISEEEEGWPREVRVGEKTFTVHQPQVESWDGSRIEAHAAIEVRIPGSDNPAYGAALITARTEVDKTERMVEFEDIQLTKAVFPSVPDQAEAYTKILREDVVQESRLMSLDRFEAALAIMEAAKVLEALPLKNDPPRVIFSINTRPLILKESSGKHYLHLFDGWMEAASLTGTWKVSSRPHRDLEKAKEDAIASGQVDLLEGRVDPESDHKPPTLKNGPIPVIHVATSPTELIVTEGDPKYVEIPGTSLFYADNTTGHIFRHSAEQKLYILLSGRWFRSSSKKGPWEYVPGGKLPPDFANIPDDSPKENIKASVPDTPQAMEAVIANSIPQMATVNRKEAKLNPPQFDGKPQFKKIEGNELQYAVNTATPIIRVAERSYFAVENGVWFTASQVDGPWTVADSVPKAIYTIPPSSPLHYVTYVQIYGSTKDTVKVGYTAGYNGTCVTRGSGFVVVYGTGYPYTPWVGSVWFGPPVTYGFGSSITYTPWTGWTYTYGFGWHWGYPMAPMGWGWGPYPWWGPVGWGYYYPYPYYRPPYGGVAWGPRGAVAWGPGGWGATTGNVYHRWGSTSAVTRRSGGYNAYTGNRWGSQVGASYNSRTGTAAAGQRAAVGNVYTGDYAYGKRGAVTNTRTGRTVTGGKVTAGNARTGQSGSAGYIRGEQGTIARSGNDIYAGKDGTVYRKGEGGWEKNSGGGWSPAEADPNRQQRAESFKEQGRKIEPPKERSEQQRASSLDRQNRSGSASQINRELSMQSLERQRSARSQGQMRTRNYRSGGYRGGGRRGGRRRP